MRNMSVIAPPSEKKSKPVKADPKFLGTSLNSTLRDLVELPDGRVVTKAQAISESLVDIAMFAESITDRISASKLIFDRVLGKAAVQKNEDVQEMPKVVLALRDDDLEDISKKAEEKISTVEEEPMVLAETEDGEYLL